MRKQIDNYRTLTTFGLLTSKDVPARGEQRRQHLRLVGTFPGAEPRLAASAARNRLRRVTPSDSAAPAPGQPRPVRTA